MHKALVKINLLRKPTKSQLFFKISVVTTGSAFCPKLYKTREISRSSAWGLFLESPGNFSLFYVCRVSIKDRSFENFENDTMKRLSV